MAKTYALKTSTKGVAAITEGGTGSTSAATAIAALGGLPLAGGVLTGGVTEAVFTGDATTGSPVILSSVGNVHRVTLTGNYSPTYTMNDGQTIRLELTNNGTSSYVAPANSTWLNGAPPPAPILTQTNGAVDIIWITRRDTKYEHDIKTDTK